jgi:hypothetical protein
MKQKGIKSLPIYPEFRDPLTHTQETILGLLNIDIKDFWGK